MNRPVDVFAYWQREDWIELNPPYQRGDVWGTKRRQNLIRSLMLGVPIPSIVVNDRLEAKFFGDGPIMYAVIDGKQRITSLLMFLNDELLVPSEWFNEWHVETDSELCSFKSLSKVGKRCFGNMPIAVSEGRLKTIEEEKEVFDLINFGGLAQGEVDSE
jgi:hypothetical protein